ncbi:MAG TPA: hypothetical protein IAC90_04160 [Candidatus Coproplasma stercorigallinarum]|nr:hypothetical protein [Candidatus Coproplasma stercorigallinarum]
MDDVKRALFYKISESCKNGGFAIIDSTEFADAIPEGGRRAAGEIDGALKELQKLGYIDIRYARGDMYCVAALKSELPEENCEEKLPDRSPTVIEVKEKINKFAVALYAAAAFLGGAAGSAVICAIAVI